MLMMTACASAQETTVSSESETVVTDETTGETTADQTESEATETEAAQEDVIIPLWNDMMLYSQSICINDVEPERWFTDFENTVFHCFEWCSNDKRINDCVAYQYNKPYNIPEMILTDSTGSEAGSAAEIYFVWGADNSYVMYIEVGGSAATVPFVPFFYNETKKCLVGYYNNDGSIGLREFYWSSEAGDYDICSIDDTSAYDEAMSYKQA